MIYDESLLDEKYLCAILEGDWKILEVKFWMKIWQYYQITELNQWIQLSMDKHMLTVPIIYEFQYWTPAKKLIWIEESLSIIGT